MAAGRHPDIAAAGSWMVPVLIDADGARSLPDVRAVGAHRHGGPRRLSHLKRRK